MFQGIFLFGWSSISDVEIKFGISCPGPAGEEVIMPNILYVMIKQGGFNRIRHLMKTTVIGVFNTITKKKKKKKKNSCELQIKTMEIPLCISGASLYLKYSPRSRFT